MSGDGPGDGVAGEIRRLSEATIREIAAGEVVERPASVVKELVENSLDADASRIEVAVDAGGTERIRVSDDGAGMSRREAALAVEEHTTSKLDGTDRLESGVATLGFRGEALHAIGAVSTMEVTTRPQSGEAATQVRVEQGEVIDVAPAGRAPGTTVEVTDLFAAMPARRKFLKSDATEFDRVSRIVSRYALANPDVAVSLAHNGREVFATPGRGDRRAAIMAVYGREVAEAMIGLPETADVTGFVSHPETTRSTREYISTYVNGRYVTASVLREAVVDAYGKQLAADRYPFAVVFLDLPPAAVDVNVHPRKLEVRFDDTTEVRERVRSAVRSALLEAGLVRASAPRGRSQPDETAVGMDADTADGDDPSQPTTERDGSSAEATQSRTATTEPASDDEPAVDADTEATTAADADIDLQGSRATTDAEATAAAERTTASSSADQHASASSSDPDDAEPGADPAGPDSPPDDGPDPRASSMDRDPAPDRKFRGGGTQTALDGHEARIDPDLERLPAMRVLGQLDDTFIVGATADGLVLVDQHAADERINYERLRDRVTEDPATQVLADPVTVELTAHERAAFPAHESALDAVGFRARLDDEGRAVVEGVPAVLGDALSPDRLRDVIDEILVEDREETSADRRVDALVSDLACHPSITANTSLSTGSAVDLLETLDACENPYACPHGRPTVIRVGREEIDDRFERDYPGHATRRID